MPVLMVALLWVMAGCGGAPGPHRTVSGEPQAVEPAEDYGEPGPLIALEGYRNDSHFFVKYRGGHGIRYSGGNWRKRVHLLEPPDQPVRDYAGPFVLPLEFHQAEPWTNLPKDVQALPVFSVAQWREFRDRLLVSVVPRAGKAGVVMHFDADDYFLYHDETGTFQATRLQEKPPDYRIQARIDFKDLLQHGFPVLERFLADHGIREREFAFNTGDTGPYSLPFLYVNVARRVAIFLQYAPEMTAAGDILPGNETVQTVGHVVRSHSGALVVRPASSLHRLFFLITHIGVDTVRPDWLAGFQDQPLPPLNAGPGMDLDAWESELDSLAGRPASNGTIRYLVDGEQFFTRLIDAVVSARKSIHVRTYIFDNDDYAMKIADLLKRRSKEGMDVKILLDGLGTIAATGAEPETLPVDYEAPSSVRAYLESDSRVDVRQAINPWMAGDHVKTTLIDHSIAFLGGMNIGREYRYEWHDLMIEVHGPIVDTLRQDFHKAWAQAGPLGDFGYVFERLKPDRTPAHDTGYPLRTLFTRAGSSEIFRAQVEAIRRAKKFIYIQNAYFTDDTILYELVRARHRGVDVRVIIPMESDRGLLTRANALAANAMLENGIRVFIYPGMSHVKAAVYDGWACLGSANLDKLSLRINKEINVATSHPQAVRDLIEVLFEPDFKRSPELEEPFPERWLDHLIEIVGDYMF